MRKILIYDYCSNEVLVHIVDRDLLENDFKDDVESYLRINLELNIDAIAWYEPECDEFGNFKVTFI